MTVSVPGPAPQIPTSGKYLRNRPFLVISLIRRPAKDVNTSKKGWMDVTGNFDTFEQPVLVDRINATHLRNANVIIDVMNAKCIKSSFTNTPPEEVVNHFLEKYRDQVTQAMDVWLSQIAALRVDVEQKSKPVDAVYSAI